MFWIKIKDDDCNKVHIGDEQMVGAMLGLKFNIN